MLSVEAASPTVVEDGVEVEYAFAMEYDGPSMGCDIPRAVPICVDRIPVAPIITQIPFHNKILPVIQPVLGPDTLDGKFSNVAAEFKSNSSVSPASVIDFEKIIDGCGHEQEVELASEVTLSPVSVTAINKECGKIGQDFEGQSELCSSSGTLGPLNVGPCESGDWSGLINSSAELGSSSISREHSRDLTPEYCESFEKSRDLSAVSEVSLASGSFQDNHLELDDRNNPDWGSSKSVLSIGYQSSTVSSFRTGECSSLPHGDTTKRPLVTFRDTDSYDDADEESTSGGEAKWSRPNKREPLSRSKKGACYRCLKGSRFTEKEACIVCNAKYCSNCVLRAMGSMPEGRKCVSCIGYSIDESKRASLGKCSKMLKRLLNDLEIRQIMKAEKLCDVNQLPPEYISINGKPLCYEELLLLQTCSNPPKNLKPGSYWYDKVSGLWGKEGEKPSQIISPHLNVGDPIQPDASNGNTQVFINGREITKPELRMLQLAGVECAGKPHFWVNDDGSYQEEGQKNTKGYIWGKAGMKLVCTLLSLPVPSKGRHPCTDEVSHVANSPNPDYIGEMMSLQKLLLVGNSGAGTSTLFKQAKILYKALPFSKDERDNIKIRIQGNVYGYLGILLEGRERFEEESLTRLLADQPSSPIKPHEGSTHGTNDKTIYSICPRLKEFSDWLLKAMASGNLEAIFPAATREYGPLAEELWNTAAIQATFKRRGELEMLPDGACYFLERAADVLHPDYEPSDLDILYAEGVTTSNGLACVEFSFPQSADDENDTSDHCSLPRYQLIRAQARGLAENCKWLEMLEDVRLVIFCISLSDYDQYTLDPDGTPTNKMLLSKKLFESLVTNPTFDHMDFLLILNKFDIFEDKVERVPLTECEWFQDFQPVISRQSSNNKSKNSNNQNPSLGQLGFHYIAAKFKRLYSNLTGRKLYVCSVKALESHSVDAALKYAREILNWEEERINFTWSEYSIYSTEASFSSSH